MMAVGTAALTQEILFADLQVQDLGSHRPIRNQDVSLSPGALLVPQRSNGPAQGKGYGIFQFRMWLIWGHAVRPEDSYFAGRT